ncbi:MAG: metal ABC transporter permease [Candidatus Bathyarchaeia archaeon]
MSTLDLVYHFIAWLFPFDFMQFRFMQQACVALILLAPITAFMGIPLINQRMVFFADAISHSAFTGVALGLILHINPYWAMSIFAMLMAISIIFTQQRTNLSSEAVTGVFFSGVIALGLVVVSREKRFNIQIQQFLYGDILTINTNEILILLCLCCIIIIFQTWGYNRMLFTSLNPTLAKIHQIHVRTYQYLYAILLSLVVIFSVWIVGVLLVTALLIVPAATARNFSKNAGQMVWWAFGVNLTSVLLGLFISAQEWVNTATGPTIILIAFGWFLLSLILLRIRKEKIV